MSDIKSFDDGSKQSKSKPSAVQLSAEDSLSVPLSSSLKNPSADMSLTPSEKTVMTAEDLAAMGATISKTLVSANQVPAAEVKVYQGKIYSLFSGKDKLLVDYTIAAYFMVNDPSPATQWGAAPNIVVGGKEVRAVEVVGGIIPISGGDGLLRRFLSTAYEHLAADVIKHVPGVAGQLQARLARRGLVGVTPMVGVSWLKGVTTATASSGAARAVMRARSVSGQQPVANQVVPLSEVNDSVVGTGTNSGATTYY